MTDVFLRWSRRFNRVERRVDMIEEAIAAIAEVKIEHDIVLGELKREQADIRRQVELLEAQVKVADGGVDA